MYNIRRNVITVYEVTPEGVDTGRVGLNGKVITRYYVIQVYVLLCGYTYM